jgi:hypothetical protein
LAKIPASYKNNNAVEAIDIDIANAITAQPVPSDIWFLKKRAASFKLVEAVQIQFF